MEIEEIDPLQIIETLQEGVLVHSATTQVLYANPRALEILGLTEDQALGKGSTDPHWCFIDKHHQVLSHQDFPVSLVLAKKCSLLNIEMGICDRSTDQVTWVLCNAIPQYSPSGEIANVVVSFLDI